MDGDCVMSGCDDWLPARIGPGVDPAQCVTCSPGYGLDSADHTCHQCYTYFDEWTDCSACVVENGKPKECLACFNYKVPMPNDSPYGGPQVCDYAPIAYCDEQEQHICLDCAGGYYWTGDQCAECGLYACDECELVTKDGDTYTSCTHCEDEYSLVMIYKNGIRGRHEQNVCEGPD